MTTDNTVLDVAVVGAGLAGVVALTYARRAGLDAIVLERGRRASGLWRDLPAWQDIQISPADWALGDLPLEGATQPHILANIEAWVARFGLADGIRLDTPVQRARHDGTAWELATPHGVVRARHLIAATGAHNTPVNPGIARDDVGLGEFHSSALRDPELLRDRDILVVGGGASAFDLLELCLRHDARHVAWVHRGLRWFPPTRKPKPIAGSVRGFSRTQASGMSAAERSAAIDADLRSRYEKVGLLEIKPSHSVDALHDQLICGRAGMLEHFAAIERHHGIRRPGRPSLHARPPAMGSGHCASASGPQHWAGSTTLASRWPAGWLFPGDADRRAAGHDAGPDPHLPAPAGAAVPPAGPLPTAPQPPEEPEAMNPDTPTDVPATDAHLIAPDTWLIPNLAPAGDGLRHSVPCCASTSPTASRR